MDASLRVKVASPCPQRWESMTPVPSRVPQEGSARAADAGDDRVRFCGVCAKNVYSLSALTRDEAEALIAAKEGKLCVRFFVRPDGTAMTSDCPVGWRRRIARRLVVAAGTVAALFGVFATARAGLRLRESGAPPTALDMWPVKNVVDWIDPEPDYPAVAGRLICPPPAPPSPSSASAGAQEQ